MKKFKWNDHSVIDFVNWFLHLHKIPDRFELENQEIIDSFKRGDNYKLWHQGVKITKREIEQELKEFKYRIIDCVPYQKCPLCNGEGRLRYFPIVSGASITPLTTTCTVCNGLKITPMYSLENR